MVAVSIAYTANKILSVLDMTPLVLCLLLILTFIL